MAEVAETPKAGNSSITDPSTFLSTIKGSKVVVKLLMGIEFHGKLQSVDGFMNVVLEDTEEVVVPPEGNPIVVRSWGDAFVRGNNILYISPV